MGGMFGVVAQGSEDCVRDLFFGTDYHSHLGTRRGGLAVRNKNGFQRFIHNIENAQFRSKFEDDITKMHGHMGIGVISDTEAQPLLVGSRMGSYGIATVGRINNIDELVEEAFDKHTAHFLEMDGGVKSQTELIATLINWGTTFEEGIRIAQEKIDGSCTLLLLTEDGIIAARDMYGRTPLIIGEKDGALCVTSETCAFLNRGFHTKQELGPGEIVRFTNDSVEQLTPPKDDMLQVCSFLWVYYGYPASTYEGRNVAVVRELCGKALAQGEDPNLEIDMVAGVPDSGTGHGTGYANESGVKYGWPYVKYTPTWPRSFMPQNQRERDLVARMKLIPIRELVEGQRILFCEDSLVRGTQLQDTVCRLHELGAIGVHMRPACPPLIHGCKFLNFSTSRSEQDLAGRRAIRALEGEKGETEFLHEFSQAGSSRYLAMVEWIRNDLGLTSLRYQTLPDLVDAIGLPKEKLCTYCWDGADPSSCSNCPKKG